MNWCYGPGHMGWPGAWWLLGAALFVTLVWVLLKSSRGAAVGPKERPEDILKRRYAKGEIDRDGYHRMLSDLKD